MIVAGKQFSFSVLILLFLLLGYFITAARKGKVPQIRKLAALDAIEEAVGRATEMGRPVHFSPGIVELTHERSPQTLAGLSVLSHVAKLCAKYDTNLVTTIMMPDVYVVAEEVVKQSFLAEGKSEQYKSDMVRFIGAEQFAYAAAAVGIMYREQVAANIMIGAWYAESLLLTEAGAQTGGIQVTGSATVAQLPFLVVASDYCLMGEEIYAASAYLSKDPVQLAVVMGQDVAKVVTIGVMGLGAILLAFGSDAIVNLVNM
ncbi:MAG: DUF6754 domain-containing protein [Bacillota bacterium]|jgi:hypothetical protein